MARLLDLQSLAGNAAVGRILDPGRNGPAVVVQRTDPPASSSKRKQPAGQGSAPKRRRIEEPDEARENEEQGDDREHFFTNALMAKDVLSILVGLSPDPRPRPPDHGYEPEPQNPASPSEGKDWSMSGSLKTSFTKAHMTGVHAIGGGLAALFRGAGKDSLVTKPKSYKDMPDKQVLRWMSTLVYLYLRAVCNIPAGRIQEVQATIHEGRIHLSTNFDAANTSLGKVVGTDPSSDMFGRLIVDLRAKQPELEGEVAADEAAEKREATARAASGGKGKGKGKKSKPGAAEGEESDAAKLETEEERRIRKERGKRRERATLLEDLRSARSEWHIAQLEAWLSADPAVRRGERVRGGLDKSVSVPSKRHGGGDLHAERRLAEGVGLETLNPAFVGGLKRPCVFCTIHLYAGKDVHPGPYWGSQSAAMLANDKQFGKIFVKATKAYGAENSDSARKEQIAVARELAEKVATMVPRTYASAPTSGTMPNTDNDTDSDEEVRDDTRSMPRLPSRHVRKRPAPRKRAAKPATVKSRRK